MKGVIMNHQNFQEAIEQLSTNEGMNSEEIKSHFNLSKEEIKAIQNNPLMLTVVPRPTNNCCCCCYQSDN